MSGGAATIYNVGGIVSNIAVKLPLTIAIVAILILLFRSLTQYTTAIEPISVPKALAEGGYTAEVAAQRLRDSLTRFAEEAQIELERSAIVTRGELPSIAVPTVGLSLDAIASAIRTFFGITRHRSISGELIVDNKLLWLRLRQNGRLLYTSAVGAAPETPDELLAEAAPAVWDESERELVAAWYLGKDPAKAIEKATRMIQRPRPGENIAAAYVIKGMALRAQGDLQGKTSGTEPNASEEAQNTKYDQAITAYSEAIKLDPQHAAARYNLGNALQLRKKYPEAAAKYREAIALAPWTAQFHNNLGVVLEKLGDHDGAVAAYREAIKQDPMNAKSYTNLGGVLQRQPGRSEEAVAAIREAIRLDPNSADANFNLAFGLQQQPGKIDEAIAQYRQVIKLNPKHMLAHYNLGVILQDQPGNSEAAIAAYREALDLDPNYSNAHNNWGVILMERGRTEEAIAKFREAVRTDPNNEKARANLADMLSKAPSAADSTNEPSTAPR